MLPQESADSLGHAWDVSRASRKLLPQAIQVTLRNKVGSKLHGRVQLWIEIAGIKKGVVILH
jgi:hypothetical protein